jgi:hypothetical protein
VIAWKTIHLLTYVYILFNVFNFYLFILTKQNTDETKKRRETNLSSTYSIYVNIKNVVCNINDDAQVFISLYDGGEGQFIR